MTFESRLEELEKRVEHMHSTSNSDFDSVEENIESFGESVNDLINSMNKMIDAIKQIQNNLFVNDEDYVSIDSHVCLFAPINDEEIHKSYI